PAGDRRSVQNTLQTQPLCTRTPATALRNHSVKGETASEPNHAISWLLGSSREERGDGEEGERRQTKIQEVQRPIETVGSETVHDSRVVFTPSEKSHTGVGGNMGCIFSPPGQRKKRFEEQQRWPPLREGLSLLFPDSLEPSWHGKPSENLELYGLSKHKRLHLSKPAMNGR
ncbi:unnamed protein product, partial [Gadus morhua 'NCC']